MSSNEQIIDVMTSTCPFKKAVINHIKNRTCFSEMTWRDVENGFVGELNTVFAFKLSAAHHVYLQRGVYQARCDWFIKEGHALTTLLSFDSFYFTQPHFLDLFLFPVHSHRVQSNTATYTQHNNSVIKYVWERTPAHILPGLEVVVRLEDKCRMEEQPEGLQQ